MSLTLTVPDLSDAATRARFESVAAAATAVDGHPPFNEQAMLDLASGRRTPLLISVGDEPVGAAILGQGELDFVIAPAHRGHGHGGEALRQILADAPDQLTAWSHGDHPAARVLANRYRLAAARTLLQLGASLTREIPAEAAPAAHSGARISAFRPGVDDEEWVALNALVFASHPEQGSLTLADLAARQTEPWFDPGDFLLARDEATGALIGYTWLKIEPGSPSGEIYVVGVHPDAAGRGLGRALLLAGMERLRDRGCTSVTLYVEAHNTPAVNLYRSLGFTDHTVDVQYRRLPS
ncbi:mycothiol synthase [Cryobacterium psychrotolerans]|uniref:Mycothiol acetyltransferase n=1 Tax=Cryobacterium psychrotolerans TaxID=386301 RepID=A0A1G9AFX9_9MICO|nr:mycothiol synthase [Cryobacterium psychrotolerans]SDK25425.1 mycothiol synthase [Cryobacterium psychrotolerans]